MADLVVHIVPVPSATLVTVAGEVDLATIPQLRERLDSVPDRDTVVEMSEVALLCAAGAGVLLDLQDRLVGAGARLVLAAVSRSVRRVLTLIGLDTRLLMSPTVDDSLSALGSGVPEQPVSAWERWPVPAEPGWCAGPIVPDGAWAQDADECSTLETGDGVAHTHAAKFRLLQAEAATRRAEAAAVTQAASELTAHATALRLQACATRERLRVCRRGKGPEPALNA